MQTRKNARLSLGFIELSLGFRWVLFGFASVHAVSRLVHGL